MFPQTPPPYHYSQGTSSSELCFICEKQWKCGPDPFNQNSDRSDREKWSTSKGGPVFFRNFSGWTEPIHWVLDRNFRKFWLNGLRPRKRPPSYALLLVSRAPLTHISTKIEAVRGSVSTAKLRGRKLPKTIQLKQNLCVNSAELRSVKTSVSVTTTLKFDLPHWLECSNSFFDSRGSYLQCESRVYFYII